jgi:feruloyl-CoA synthase
MENRRSDLEVKNTAGRPEGNEFAQLANGARDLRDIPMRKLNRPPPRIELRDGPDGVTYVGSGYALETSDELLIDYIERGSAIRPDQTFLAERGQDRQWRRLTYRQALRDTAAVATWLIRQGFGPDSAPVMILSENGIEHALLLFGAMRAGATVVPVSPSYALDSDLSRLGYVLDMVEPGLVYAREADRYDKALKYVAAPGRHLLSSAAFDELLRDVDDAAVAKRRKEITGDTVAKILLTSGSTGQPKGAVNTHANITLGSQMTRQMAEPFDPERVHTVLDWLPWHHTFGGNAVLNGVLRVTGTLYVDGGRPLPGRFNETIENLREISPTGFGSVPAAYAMLADALERDADLRRNFFKNLRGLSYGGAVLPQTIWERMQRLAVMELGERLPFGTGWGMTESTATGTSVHWNVERSGLIGLPLPGATLKLVPSGDRYELRIKGPHIMARYHRNDELNRAAFDDEGYFRTGDAVRWIDPAEPLSGLEFAGRLAEDFKLQSGTWVQAGILRRDLVDALQPLIYEAVIAAPDRPWLGALVWLGAANGGDLRTRLAERLAVFNRARKGSSTQIARLLILSEPPSPSAGEITDKRSINLRCVLERRAADVAALYAEPLDPRIIVPAGN